MMAVTKLAIEEDNQRRSKGGFGPYLCHSCGQMKCGAHDSKCSLCESKEGDE